ncbi:MAG: hypothetical protein PVI75_08245 [Gammaproteobacteria bacterium]|jgi:hypothetical protein
MPKMNTDEFIKKYVSSAKGKSLNLVCLFMKTHAELRDVIPSIPKNITSLNLALNKLGEKKSYIVCYIIDAIPDNITSFNLCANSFSNYSGFKGFYLDKIMHAINKKKNIKSLNLSGNYLGDISTSHLCKTFKALSTEITSFSLEGNHFYKKGSELVKIMKSLKEKNIKSLNLSDNDLGSLSTDDLVKIFKNLPKNIKSLNLSNNKLGSLSTDDLVKIFQAIPKTVTIINLNYNKLFYRKISQINKILNTLNHFSIEKKEHKKSKSKHSKPINRTVILNDGNGETDFDRALLIVLRSSKSKLSRLPFEMTCKILSWIFPESEKAPTIVVQNKISTLFDNVEEMRKKAKEKPNSKEAKTLTKFCLINTNLCHKL